MGAEGLNQLAQNNLRFSVRLQPVLKLTFMVITHDLAMVKATAKKMIVRKNGRILERDGRIDIFGAPQQDYTKRLLASMPQMAPEWLTNARERELRERR